MNPNPDLYGRHAAVDDVCHRGDCVWCIRHRWLTLHADRRLSVVPPRHRLVQVVEATP